MAHCGRAHVIKAALLAGLLLVLLNFYNYLLESKIENSTAISMVHVKTSQWPKRTRSSSEMLNISNVVLSNKHNSNSSIKHKTQHNNNNGSVNGWNHTTKTTPSTPPPQLPLQPLPYSIDQKYQLEKIPKQQQQQIHSNTTSITHIHRIKLNSTKSVILSKQNISHSINKTHSESHLLLPASPVAPASRISSGYATINNNSNNNNNNNNNNTQQQHQQQQQLNATAEDIVYIIEENRTVTGWPETATRHSIFHSIMTTLGLTLPHCPLYPPNLDGPIEVNTTLEQMTILERRLAATLLPGGWFRPKECSARDRVAIIIPYRDRATHLPIFLANLHPFLQKQQIEYGIFVIEQIPDGLFNRAALMNVGYVEALKLADWDCFIFHDVDLLPMDDRNLYNCPDQPRHMSVAVDTMGFKLPYSSIFGGVSAMTTKQFKTVNGFSNSFWGWGGEDDDMSNRLKHYGFHIARYPVNIARYTMLNHKKEKANPKRYEKLVNGAKKYDVEGLNSLRYKIQYLERKILYTWVLVELKQESSS